MLRMSRIHVDVHGHAASSVTVEEAAGDDLLRSDAVSIRQSALRRGR